MRPKGFTYAGDWNFGNYSSTEHLKHLKGISFDLKNEYKDINEVIYCFTVNGELFYIGETSQKLKQRLEGYRYGNKYLPDTDNRVKEFITENLENNLKIEIHIYQPKIDFDYFGDTFTIPLYRSLEQFLINKYKPILNKQSK